MDVGGVRDHVACGHEGLEGGAREVCAVVGGGLVRVGGAARRGWGEGCGGLEAGW